MPKVLINERTFEQGDALRAQIEAFVDSIRTHKRPLVDGEAGLHALKTAIRIAALVKSGAS